MTTHLLTHLRTTATNADDPTMVALCDRALAGDPDAIIACIDALIDAALGRP